MTNSNQTDQTLLMGTAQWGWTVPKAAAFQLLDSWIAAGRRGIDAATNYPINKEPADFRASEKILLEYIHAHGLQDLNITLKIGSLSNMRTPEINLSPSFLMMMAEEYRRLFGNNLKGIMLHWDNRQEYKEIETTLEALAQIQRDLGLRPGLSGIKFPETYMAANQGLGLDFDIQVKHNVFQSDLGRFQHFQTSQHRFFAYGINAGGVQLEGPYPTDSTFLARGGDPEKVLPVLQQIREYVPQWNTAFVRPPIRTMNQLGLLFASLNPRIDGLVLGFSNLSQLQTTLNFWRDMETFDYSDIYERLSKF